MKKQERVRKHGINPLSLINKVSLSDNELDDVFKLSLDKPLHEWFDVV